LPRFAVSADFADYGHIPPRNTADGAGLSPRLSWRGEPAASSYGVLVEDADATAAHPLVLTLVVNLPGDVNSLSEGALNDAPGKAARSDLETPGYLHQAWLPPPPPVGAEHRYAFQVFAFRFGPAFPKLPGLPEFIEAVLEHAIAGGCLIGIHKRV
jgi:phosphatidylethanolamine-binding protein (PEBP) family uncharacterized protein